MPHPFLDFATRPLVPKQPIEWLQNQLDERELNERPEEARMGGFAAGALEGLRGLTSPLSLASMVPALRGLRGAAQAAGSLGRAGPVVRGLKTPSGITPFMEEAFSKYMKKPW